MTPFVLRRRYEGLGLALLLAMMFLAASVWLVYRELEAILGASKITGSISWVSDFNPVLAQRLGVFAGCVILVHVAFGLLAWGLARMTSAALSVGSSRAVSALVVTWSLLLAFLILGLNAIWFPASRFAFADFGLPNSWRGISTPTLLMLGIGAALSAIAAVAQWRRRWLRLPTGRALGVFGVIAAGGCGLYLAGGARSEAVPASASPHIIIVGLDSVRNDLSEVHDGTSLTPNVDAFLATSHRFEDTVSPLARTFPAWVSILTGRHPVATNTRFNLMPRSTIHEGDTLADALKPLGYRSVYATDEVRFANFDDSFGFDDLITPPMGASDFVIGAIGDQPLVNVVAGSPAGALMFPQIHANRADAVTYLPEHFTARLGRELSNDGPTFLAVHLTLAHWPYSRAGQKEPTSPPAFRPAYRDALREVDLQFRDVLALLEQKGFLSNAVVVVLSDHGEALGYPSDSMVRKTGTSNEIWDSLWGHGTSVLSPHQYSVLLAMRAYGQARLPGAAAAHDWPVTLEDVRPTLEELATGRAPDGVDGVSLVPYLTDPTLVTALRARVRFTETCFNTIKMLKGKITKSGVVSEAGIYYEMDPETGWVQLRRDRLPEILARKQRAAISEDALLAAIPSWSDSSVTYLFTDRRAPDPRRLEAAPDPAVDPEAARLWAALHKRFPGELQAPGQPPRM